MTVKAKALAHRDTCESLTIHPHAGSDPRGAKGAEAPPPPPPSKLMRCKTHILTKILQSEVPLRYHYMNLTTSNEERKISRPASRILTKLEKIWQL